VTVAVAEDPRVTLLGETEQPMPAGFGETFVTRFTVPVNPSRLDKETVAVVVEPTAAVIAVGLTVSENE
jgi:hypothetical protein